MGDRLDRLYMLEDAKVEREQRADDLKAVPLLNDDQRQGLQSFLERQCGMKTAEAKDVLETIDHLAGEKGARAREVIKDALEGHVSKPFLKNDSNFAPITSVIDKAIAEREVKIEALHQTPVNPSPPTAKNTPKI